MLIKGDLSHHEVGNTEMTPGIRPRLIPNCTLCSALLTFALPNEATSLTTDRPTGTAVQHMLLTTPTPESCSDPKVKHYREEIWMSQLRSNGHPQFAWTKWGMGYLIYIKSGSTSTSCKRLVLRTWVESHRFLNSDQSVWHGWWIWEAMVQRLGFSTSLQLLN